MEEQANSIGCSFSPSALRRQSLEGVIASATQQPTIALGSTIQTHYAKRCCHSWPVPLGSSSSRQDRDIYVAKPCDPLMYHVSQTCFALAGSGDSILLNPQRTDHKHVDKELALGFALDSNNTTSWLSLMTPWPTLTDESVQYAMNAVRLEFGAQVVDRSHSMEGAAAWSAHTMA